jgi:hypothetical protein
MFKIYNASCNDGKISWSLDSGCCAQGTDIFNIKYAYGRPESTMKIVDWDIDMPIVCPIHAAPIKRTDMIIFTVMRKENLGVLLYRLAIPYRGG